MNELACAIHVAQGRYEDVVALEQRLKHTNPAIARAPSVRACFGQAHDGLGHTRRALELYLEVAAQLGDATPPRLYTMIARNHLELGETRAARSWLDRARAAAARDQSLAAQVRSLEKRLRRQGRRSAVPPRASAP